MNASELIVRKRDLHDIRVVRAALPDTLAPGSVLLAIDSFALTANNITYAAFGDAMQYWHFFPAADPQWGRIPVWGFADVIASACDGIAVGERFYGYLPMSSHLLVEPERVSPAGFADAAAHRKGLHPVYNQYTRCSTDPGYRRDMEAQQMLLRPLFATSFLIDDFLADNGFFGADTVILSSASSKTAYGTAFCLSQHARKARRIGLTSQSNLAFVRGLGIYDQVLAYDAIGSLDPASAVYVDMSGSATVRAAVHNQLADRLKHSCAVGGTHWEDLGGGGGLPGPRPTLFFAPAQIKKRNADWGAAELQRRIGAAWSAFMGVVVGDGSGWLKVVEARGEAAATRCYLELLAGHARPDEGHILSLVSPAK
jgi:hypothetical protein